MCRHPRLLLVAGVLILLVGVIAFTGGQRNFAAESWDRRLEAGRKFWSFQKVVRPDPPKVAHADRVRNPIDSFVLAALEKRGIDPAPIADRRALIRRVSFDLLGLPPSPEEVEAFINDKSSDAYPKLIEKLLASPHYGERWGRHWLDVARYADSGGYETDIYYKNAWRYRDWVMKAINDDMPYDRFVREQIAGDELAPNDLSLSGSYVLPKEKLDHLQARIATGFYALGPQVHESNMDARKIVHERLTDWVDTTGSVFLGLTLGCARCHDHKFDPVSQEDYYRLQAVFAGSKEEDIPVVHAMAIASNKQHYPRLLAIDEARRAYRLFEQRAGRKDEAERQRLLERIAKAVLDLPESIPDAPGGAWDGLMEIPSATVLGHERPGFVPAIHVLRRGDLSRPKDRVTPGLPALLATVTDVKPDLPGPTGGRKELALWLTRPDHPLTARVMVNRIWQWHFGQGLVSTPNDFGKMGQPPSHPELLDWLASEFVAKGWSLKALHRLILTSATYQQSSLAQNEKAGKIDPQNRLLWRMNRQRLTAEALWDNLHATAGTINLKMGGRPVVPPLTEDELSALRDRWQWTTSADPKEHTRRGIYVLVRRNFRFPMFEAFDAPVNSVSCPARDTTTVAPQALWFLNNHTTYRAAIEFAARLARSGNEPAAWVDQAWGIALGRGPSAEEKREAVALFEALAKRENVKLLEGAPEALAKLPPARAAALVKLCLAVFNLNEFAYID